MKYKLVLKRRGRYKKPFYIIVVVNLKNRIVDKLGNYDPFANQDSKNCKVNGLLLLFWLSKGLKQNFLLSKLLKIFFI